MSRVDEPAERQPVPAPPAQTTRPLSVAMLGLRGIPATYGGVERAVEELSAALVARGHRVTVFARSAYSDPDLRSYRGIEIVNRGQIHTKHLEAVSHTLVSLLAAMRSGRFDVLHLHATGPAVLSFLPRMGHVPAVATVQGLDYRREKWGPFASAALRVAARAAATVPTSTIVVSKELQRHYRERFGAETYYIPNGVPLASDEPGTPVDDLEADRFLLFLGRLVPEKHIHTLIGAYRQVETDVPLVIAGPHSHSPDYVEQLHRLAAGDPRVRLIGARYGGEKTWLLKSALAFAQPSSVEGLSIGLLEALASGRFPIVSDIPENVEAVTLGSGTVLGEQARVGDEADWARALRATLARADRAVVGEELRRHVVRTYDWPSIAAATEAVYCDSLDRRRR